MKTDRFKRALSIIMIVVLGGSIMFGLFGCKKDGKDDKTTAGKTYKVDYCGQKDAFRGAKDSYKAGEKVEFYFDMIATDTDYSFFVDGERFNPGYSDDRGYIFSFTMPEHDVTVEYTSRNTMIYVPPEEIMLIDYYDAVTGTDGYDHSREYVLSSYPDDEALAKLEVIKRDDAEGGGEQTEIYLVPYTVVDECYDIIEKNGFKDWDKLPDKTAIDGGYTSCKYKDLYTDEYITVSTGDMPEDGERQIDEVGVAISKYIDINYKVN